MKSLSGNITKRAMSSIVKAANGVLEEDFGIRTMRVFQAVAPDGKRWRANGCVHYRIEMDTMPNWIGEAWNVTELERLSKAMAMGLEEIPTNEMDLYSTE